MSLFAMERSRLGEIFKELFWFCRVAPATSRINGLKLYGINFRSVRSVSFDAYLSFQKEEYFIK